MTTASKQLTGRHVALIFVSAFTVIIGVNLTLAYKALSTFPGLEVKNSYVASQHFDENRTAQQALGWSVLAQARGDQVVLSITDRAGQPVQVAELDATLGRATHVRDDQAPEFVFDGAAYVAPAVLTPGNWNLRMKAVAADGTVFQQRVILHVPRGAT
ncbi:RdxH [Roseobacter cerasinus]|uniref:RdxH n=1 Tax=Roseobacter cerasinus TaxID=2602289 RepID=A0A640VSX2_9RHOB|nr:FixH family protein [Roseobacter cerasinus]GFE51129.1 RdxH [Roseobacter cerasinus]